MSVDIELKNGEVLKGNILAKALNVLVVHTENNKFFLVSRYQLAHPEKFKFREA